MARSGRRAQPIPPVPEHPLGRSAEKDPFDTGDKDLQKPVNVGNVSGERLRSFIERIERLGSEIRSLQDDVKEIKKEAKGSGFDVKVINHILKIRKQDKDDRDEFDALVDTYLRAIGM